MHVTKQNAIDAEKYRSVFDNSLLAIMRTQVSGKILDANKAACEMFGYSLDEIRSLGRQGIIEDNKDLHKQQEERLSQRSGIGIITGIRKNGERFQCEYSSTIYTDADGEDYTSTILIDITRRLKETEEIRSSNMFLNMIIDNSGEAFIILDHELNVMSFNKVAEDFAIQLIGVPLKKGNKIYSVAKPDRIEKLSKTYEHILQGNRLETNYTLNGSEGEIKNFLLSYTPIRGEEGKVMNIMINAKDVTNEENAKQQILKERNNLETVLDETERIMDFSPDMICTIDGVTGNFIRVSLVAEKILGYPKDDLVGKPFINFVHPDDHQNTLEIFDYVRSGAPVTNFENKYIRKDGSVITILWSANYHSKHQILYAIGKDASEKLIAEEKLLLSEEKYRLLFYSNPIPMWIYDISSKYFLEVNDAAIEHYGYTRQEFLSKTIFDIRPETEISKLQNVISIDRGSNFYHHEWQHLKKSGETITVEISSHVIDYEGHHAVLVSANDITRRILLEKDLIKYNSDVKNILESITDGFLAVNMDWQIKYCNAAAERILSYNVHQLSGKNLWSLNSEALPKSLFGLFQDAIDKKEAVHFEHLVKETNTWLEITGYPSADGLSIYFKTITDRKLGEEQIRMLNNSLERRAAELSVSNQELENFAYVASHDLQEPLRMITSFLQLFEQKYGDTIDTTGKRYIDFAVDGASRMNRLILDLLEYSKLGKKHQGSPSDMGKVVDEVLLNLQERIITNKAVIQLDKLPVLPNVIESQMFQLMQNLIGNALKYKKADVLPHIKIACRENDNAWLFSVSDNGIGIDAKFAEKIFVIFQRLHNKNEFSGTGIGLAICKKIVELHGGKIWMQSEKGSGTTFYFTIPK